MLSENHNQLISGVAFAKRYLWNMLTAFIQSHLLKIRKCRIFISI